MRATNAKAATPPTTPPAMAPLLTLDDDEDELESAPDDGTLRTCVEVTKMTEGLAEPEALIVLVKTWTEGEEELAFAEVEADDEADEEKDGNDELCCALELARELELPLDPPFEPPDVPLTMALF